MKIGFEVGDHVWEKVKSHPWWPGWIIDEATASSSMKQTKIEVFLFVAFFGDNIYGWLVSTELLVFEPHYHEKSKNQTQAFQMAVQEAIYEVNKRAAPKLACRCWDPSNYRQACSAGLLHVDISGCEEGAIYSTDQWSWEEFPAEILSFVQQLGLRPINTHRDGDSKKVPFVHQVCQILWLTLQTGGVDILLGNDFLQYCSDMFSAPSKDVDINSKPFPQKYVNIADPLKEHSNLGCSVSEGPQELLPDTQCFHLLC